MEHDRRAQQLSRNVRKTLRRTILGSGFALLALIYFMPEAGSNWMYALILLFMLVTIVAAIVLFFMGGLAPQNVRKFLSERERRMLDD